MLVVEQHSPRFLLASQWHGFAFGAWSAGACGSADTRRSGRQWVHDDQDYCYASVSSFFNGGALRSVSLRPAFCQLRSSYSWRVVRQGEVARCASGQIGKASVPFGCWTGSGACASHSRLIEQQRARVKKTRTPVCLIRCLSQFASVSWLVAALVHFSPPPLRCSSRPRKSVPPHHTHFPDTQYQ